MPRKKSEYYILKCPVCDKDITKVMEMPNAEIVCPNCKRVLNLYTVFGYNMWLAENGNAEKVNKRPITISDKQETNQVLDVCIDEDIEDDNIDYSEFNFDSITDNNPSNLQILLSQNADICAMQYNYLIKKGFTRLEAVDMVLKLIEHGFIL